MDDTENIEEEITRTNFTYFLDHCLTIKGSMGLFPEKVQGPDISAIEHHDTSQQFLHSKSSSTSVFDRLVSDTNRRTGASKKVNDYRIMLGLEYENSFLSQAKLSRANEDNLLTRLVLDTQRRYQNYEILDNYKKAKEKPKEFPKFPQEKTNEIVSRLFVDSRQKIEERQNVKKQILEEEIKLLKNIRNQRHPRRELNKDIIDRITTSSSPSRCKHLQNSNEVTIRSSKSVKKIRDVVDRLHKSSPLKIHIPYKSENHREQNRMNDIRKKINDDYDDYLIKFKANGGKKINSPFKHFLK